MNRKAQGISLETIIVAAIVLIVLVVLWAIFTGRLQLFNRSIDEGTKDNTCQKTNAPNDQKGEWITGFTCPDTHFKYRLVYSDTKEHSYSTCCFKKVALGKCSDNGQCTSDKCQNNRCVANVDTKPANIRSSPNSPENTAVG